MKPRRSRGTSRPNCGIGFDLNDQTRIEDRRLGSRVTMTRTMDTAKVALTAVKSAGLLLACKSRRRGGPGIVMALLLAMHGIANSASGCSTAVSGQAARIDADGTLHIPALTLPASEFWSSELRRAYVAHVKEAGETSAGIPSMTAPKSEWDAFYKNGEGPLVELLAKDLKSYRVNVVDTTIAGVHVGIIAPSDGVAAENRHRVLIQLHGGLFNDLTFGEVESIPIASIGKLRVITVDYREEPKYRYPAPSEDVEAVYRELLKQYKPREIGVFGASFGGLLTGQAVSWLQAKNLPRPGAIGIFEMGLTAVPFPCGKWGDSELWAEAVPTGDHSRFESDMKKVAWYLEGVDSSDPRAYPGSSDAVLANFPPTLFLTGTRALDLSPVVVAHARLLKLKVDSSLYVIEGGWHGVQDLAEGSPEKRDANAYVAYWFAQHLAP
jgi:monoterpene epsilon-lactone hydrolase